MGSIVWVGYVFLDHVPSESGRLPALFLRGHRGYLPIWPPLLPHSSYLINVILKQRETWQTGS